MNHKRAGQSLPSIAQYHYGPERKVFDPFERKNQEYKLFTYDGHLKHAKVHEYNHVHEYEKVREYDKVRESWKIHEPTYKEYKPNFVTKEQYKTLRELKPRKSPESIELPEIKPKREKTEDKSFLVGPEAPVHEHEYKEYKCEPFDLSKHHSVFDKKFVSYMDKKIEEYGPVKEYKLTKQNFNSFKRRNIDDDWLDRYRPSAMRPVVLPEWGIPILNKLSLPPDYSSLSTAKPKPSVPKTVTFDRNSLPSTSTQSQNYSSTSSISLEKRHSKPW